jgi:hypothetical protein
MGGVTIAPAGACTKTSAQEAAEAFATVPLLLPHPVPSLLRSEVQVPWM